ncbi:hypothetical protein Tco_1045025 [Tanacetum coccineum]|uniref:Reverse transcriptase domain-containing protein n=1 Tax=Tanacetum coccineum TaxID=301880 RepID=A0ABQ5GSN2_9ASTR
MRTTMKNESGNQGPGAQQGKLLLHFGQGFSCGVGSKKELWDSRKHQTWKEAGEEEMSKVLGPQEAKNRRVKLPLILVAHLGRNESSQPLQSSLTSNFRVDHSASRNNMGAKISLLRNQIGNPPARGIPTYHPEGGYIPQTFTKNDVPSYNGTMYPAVTPSSNYPFYTQPMYAPPNMPMYSNSTGSFADSTCSVTPFVYWIEDYPLLDGIKIPSHIGSYDGKGDPDNFLHLFEGAFRMQKWLMPIACHMFAYTLKDSARIWWNSQKTSSILNYEDLKAKFRYTDDTLQILGLHEEQRISGFVHGLRTRSLVEHLSTYLSSTYKGLMEKTYTWIKAREMATNRIPNDRRENFERLRKSS